jgi:ABC-2 type transport system ATP-binding protein
MSVLTATGAGVRHHRQWLVQGLDLRIEPGETVAVVGPPGSGRTSALLALARRLRLSAGKIEITGTASLGHVPGVVEPEPVFTVTEHIRERLALLGRGRDTDVALHGLDPELRGRELTPYQRQVLGLILAGLNEPSVIALDGVDAGLDAGERTALWALLGVLAADGVAVLVTAREVDPSVVDQVVRLSDPQTEEPGRVVVMTAAEYAESLSPAGLEAHGVPADALSPAHLEAHRVPAGPLEPAHPEAHRVLPDVPAPDLEEDPA